MEDLNTVSVHYFLSQIRDGLSDNDPLIGHYCGFPDPNPSPVVTIGSSMLVKFESTIGTREVGNGFRAVWSLGL